MFDSPLLRILDEEVAKEKAKKKKKVELSLRREKKLQYYSGWHKDEPVTQTKEEKQKKLSDII